MRCIYTIVFNHNNRLNKLGQGLIQIRVYQNLGYKQKTKHISTGLKVTPKQWDDKKNQIKNHPNAINLNASIRKQIAELQDFELKISNSGKDFNISMFEDLIKGKYTNSFLDFIRKEIEQMSLAGKHKMSSIGAYKASFTNLNAYRKDILFTELDYKLIEDFDTFLRQKGHKQNTIAKIHKHLKYFISKAVKRGYLEMHKNPYNNFKSKVVQSTKIPLSTDEVKRIEEIEFPEDYKHLDRIRDYFLFMVYTGLRWSDFITMKKENLNSDKEKNLFLDFKPQKTETTSNKRVYIPLKSKAIDLINKYSDEGFEYIFIDKTDSRQGRSITNQYINRELKKVATFCHIKKTVSCHVARHTFATLLLNATPPVPIDVVSKLLGHTNIQTTIIYAKTLPVKITESLKNFDFDF